MKRKKNWIIAAASILAIATCRGGDAPAKLKGVGFQLADGSPISQASTDEYNPYVVKMTDGYLMLVFGSDRSCGGCTANTHNIFVARSVATYNNDAKLPYFNTPTALTVGGTPLNYSGAVTFAAAASGTLLRIYLNNVSGSIQYADVTPTTTPYNVAALTSTFNYSLVKSIIIGIDSTGTKLIARSAASSAVYLFDPHNNVAAMPAIGTSNTPTSAIHVNPAFSGQADGFLVMANGLVSSAAYSIAGSAQSYVNTSIFNAKVTAKSFSALQTGVQNAELVFLSGVDSGATKQDLYILDGTNAAHMWNQMTAKPAGGTATNAAWNTPSTTATRVYGQGGNFAANTVNNGGRTANSIAGALHPAVDDTGLYIADQVNNRALYYPGTSTTATRVYCQNNNYTTATTGTTSAVFCYGVPSANVTGVAIDPTGVYVVDLYASRVLFFSGTNFDASVGGRVYGQTLFTTNTVNNGGLSATSLNQPDKVVTDATGVYMADTFNNRILHYPGTSTTADRVYGQSGNFGANASGTTATTLNGPRSMVVDSDGIYIADTGNHRVLFFPGTSTTATRVYGQSGSFTTGTANNGGVSANSFNDPWGIKVFAGGLYVTDFSNHRVLYFANGSTTASVVWGQAGSFASNTANNGGLSASSFNNPIGVEVDTTGMYVADTANNRVLFFAR